jgi:hypothetical protein
MQLALLELAITAIIGLVILLTVWHVDLNRREKP